MGAANLSCFAVEDSPISKNTSLERTWSDSCLATPKPSVKNSALNSSKDDSVVSTSSHSKAVNGRPRAHSDIPQQCLNGFAASSSQRPVAAVSASHSTTTNGHWPVWSSDSEEEEVERMPANYVYLWKRPGEETYALMNNSWSGGSRPSAKQRSSSSPSLYKKSYDQAASQGCLPSNYPSAELLKCTSPTNSCPPPKNTCNCDGSGAGAKKNDVSSKAGSKQKPAHRTQGSNCSGHNKCKCPNQNPLCCDRSVVSSSRTSIQNGDCSAYANGSCDNVSSSSGSRSRIVSNEPPQSSSSSSSSYERMNGVGEAQFNNGSVESLNGEQKEELDDITRQIENLTRTVDDLQKSLSSLNSDNEGEEVTADSKGKKKARKEGKKGSKLRLHLTSSSRKNKNSEVDLSDPVA